MHPILQYDAFELPNPSAACLVVSRLMQHLACVSHSYKNYCIGSSLFCCQFALGHIFACLPSVCLVLRPLVAVCLLHSIISLMTRFWRRRMDKFVTQVAEVEVKAEVKEDHPALEIKRQSVAPQVVEVKQE